MHYRYLLPMVALAHISAAFAAPKPPQANERIVMIGNGLGERMLDHPYFESKLMLSHPTHNLYIRNACRPGDTAGFRPHPSRKSQWAFPGAEKFHPQHKPHGGNGFHPTPDQWLTELKPDTVIAFFGYNESYDGPAGLANFKGEIDAFVKHTLAQQYNGKAAPRLVLVSPIAYENLSASRDLPDGRAENANIALYSQAMAEAAAANNVEFVDVFNKTLQLYPTLSKPFTRNGFLPNDDGYRTLSTMLVEAIYGKAEAKSKASPEAIVNALIDRNWHWTNDYRMLNGVHVDGQRYNPFGPKNYPDETIKIRQMTEVRDQSIWALLNGKPFDLAAANKATHQLPPVETNYQPSAKNGTTEYKYGEEAEKTITTPEGYQAKLFASEKEFPNLANPMQLSFDNKGRLWVATMPSYPHYRPGDAMPNDMLLIYEDTNGDGKADKETVFADKLHLPIGFEFAPGGVYVSQEPHLIFMADTNGDDKADTREVVLTGFDSHDTHHAIGAFTADASGAIMMCEGVFLHSNVETPYGPIRGINGGFFRFSPQKTKLERTSQFGVPNPWGFAFDKWGQDFLIHTSGPTWNWHLPLTLKGAYGVGAPGTKDLVPAGHSVRPTSGLEFVSSRHFPDEVQGDALIGNAIGFLGLKQHSIVDDGTGYKTAHRHELLKSSDGNFRPVDHEFAPDGSLYVIDWHNILIGHMQHNTRDPLRDHVHGRIYRVTYPSRPLVKPVAVDGVSIEALLENLKQPEYRARYRSRRELREHPVTKVIPAVKKWAAELDTKDANYPHYLLEALWTTWALNAVDSDLLRKCLTSSDYHARAAAVRVLRYSFDQFPDALDLLKKAAADENGRVRLEATMAATWYDKREALEVVTIAKAKGVDDWSRTQTDAAAARLQGKVEVKEEENPMPPIPANLTAAEKASFAAGHAIYYREGHCATCHQKDGKGLDPAFPPLHNSIFVHGNPDRLIKLTLHGLIGAFELNGKKYDGQVPMTPFGGMLNDKEIADVLTFARNHFGNSATAITPQQVSAVRQATKSMTGFYRMETLLQEHPLEK